MRAHEFSDDRLEIVLRLLSDDQRWAAFEAALNPHLVRVYDLRTERVHVDSTSASAYTSVSEEGLFQFGHSKDHRPDLPQVKIMQAVLDPLGMPLATDVVSGERADDPLYIPCIERVQQSLGRNGLLFVGDCKPTVSIGVTYAVVYTYGSDDGRISPTRCAVIVAGLGDRYSPRRAGSNTASRSRLSPYRTCGSVKAGVND